VGRRGERRKIEPTASDKMQTKEYTMKCRAIVVLDYLFEDDFLIAAEEQTKLQEAIASIVKGNKRVVFHQVDMKERRGDQTPDIKTMKFRNS
tara:strand:- start:275 stop:550 length:276 start_codon:yes stop_codon:yes gene_type:complete